MRASNLPSTRGQLSIGFQLRTYMARAISELETRAGRASVLPPGVASLETFLAACTTALTAIKARPASILITGTFTLSTTQQVVVTKTPLSGSGVVVTSAASGTTYLSSDVTKFTVGVNGLLTKVGAGTATLTAYNGNKSHTVTITVS